MKYPNPSSLLLLPACSGDADVLPPPTTSGPKSASAGRLSTLVITDSLRQYLRQYTYIDYDNRDWFSRLLYALPISGMLLLLPQPLEKLPDQNENTPLLRAVKRL